MSATANRKMGKLYEGLNERERVRMLAKLARAHDTSEMDRLRNATPMAHADAYNRALGLLRTLNGNLPDWLTIFHMGMQRDRFRLQHVLSEMAQRTLQQLALPNIWKLIAYPVTESEYRVLVELERAEPYELDAYAQRFVEMDGDELVGLNPHIAEFLQHLPADLKLHRFDSDEWEAWRASPEYEQEDQEQDRIYGELTRQLLALIEAAIAAGELPKPKKTKGEPSLPLGVLSDWGEGTTPETYKPLGPSYFVPVLQLLGGDFAKWEIHPDDETDTVKERRRDMLAALLPLTGRHNQLRDAIEHLEPPKTAAQREAAQKHADELHETRNAESALIEIAFESAIVHGTHRAQLEGLAEALAIVQQEDFYGEDPLWPETRAQIETAQEEGKRFDGLWQDANSLAELRSGLRKLQGLEPYPEGDFAAPAPLPESEPDTAGTLALIRGWSQ